MADYALSLSLSLSLCSSWLFKFNNPIKASLAFQKSSPYQNLDIPVESMLFSDRIANTCFSDVLISYDSSKLIVLMFHFLSASTQKKKKEMLAFSAPPPSPELIQVQMALPSFPQLSLSLLTSRWCVNDLQLN